MGIEYVLRKQGDTINNIVAMIVKSVLSDRKFYILIHFMNVSLKQDFCADTKM